MGVAKIIASVDVKTIARLDRLVKEGKFPSRSSLIEQVIDEKLNRLGKSRIARECARLDPVEERVFADEGMTADSRSWQES